MTNLKCHVSNCTNYCDGLCVRPDIKVDGCDACDPSQTCCKSFDHKSEQMTNSVGGCHPSKETAVRCDAHNCVYNTNTICSADCICVEGDGACCCRETKCATFQSR